MQIRFFLIGMVLLTELVCSPSILAQPREASFWQTHLKLPIGFRIDVFCRLPEARSLSVAVDGTVYVGTRRDGRVFALQDRNGDGRCDEVIVVYDKGIMPNGVAFYKGDLYVAEVHRILRFPDIQTQLKRDNRPQYIVVTDALPKSTAHGWKFIRFGPDGFLYVPVGAPCNVCLVEDPHGTVLKMDPQSGDWVVYARGVRNSVGFDWDPQTQRLWFTDNGRDYLGDDLPPDELNRVDRPGSHFGFPYCHGFDLIDPQFGHGKERFCRYEATPPVLQLGPHVAALGMRFITNTSFPDDLQGNILIAEHGSWNRSQKIGYRVMLVRLNERREPIAYVPFIEGWLQGQKVLGRPVDVAWWHDGSLLVSDDFNGLIYRVVYEPIQK